MKFLVLFILISLAAFANSSDDYDWDRVHRLGEISCTEQCQHLRYEMVNFRRDMCNEVFRCELFDWDEETQECLSKSVEERKYSIPCRDIPAL